MILFVKGIFFDQSNKIRKMLDDLTSSAISQQMDRDFLDRTIDMLQDLDMEIQDLIGSGDLEIDLLSANNIIKYNTFHESLLSIELFRYLIIINYGEPEEYFKKKIGRIYQEINCLQKQPIVTTISNSENYYWALPSYDIIAVPAKEEKNLLNLPDIYHEMGHLIYNQHELYLKGNVEELINGFYQDEIQRVITEQRAVKMISFFREKNSSWIDSWIMEFTCDFIATYLVGPAYAWTNLKLSTLSSGKDSLFLDSPSHPSDEARMRGIFFILRAMGHGDLVDSIEQSWNEFLSVTSNPRPANYHYIYPQPIIEALANNVIAGCQAIDLRDYTEQVRLYANPISKILNDSWTILFQDPSAFSAWERERILEIGAAI